MNILKILISLFLISSLNASNLSPNKKFEISGGATDLVINNNKLYVATNDSKIDIFKLNDFTKISTIVIPKTTDFMGEVIGSKIYSLDVLNEDILILSQGKRGARKIDIFTDGKLVNIIPESKRLFIAQAKFIDNSKIIFSLLSNELLVYDLKKKKILYNRQVSQSKFSYFALDEKKEKIVVADESGNLKLCDVKDGNILKTFKNQNLDNVFQVDFKNNKILTAGQDRRAVFYDDFNTYYKESGFLIYSCALNKNATLGAYSSNENNDITIFDTSSKTDLYKLKKNKMTPTKILFINDNEILVASDDKNINYYKIKE